MAYQQQIGKLRATGVSGVGTLSLPAGATILSISAKNNTANAITGGLKIGSAVAGVDIVAALTVAASVVSPPATLLLPTFAAAQTLYYDAVVAWNSANIDLTVIYAV